MGKQLLIAPDNALFGAEYGIRMMLAGYRCADRIIGNTGNFNFLVDGQFYFTHVMAPC
jgi:hypothetical protein